jgi:methylmalonyl-CoA carboxyltransferase 1.3S subunit
VRLGLILSGSGHVKLQIDIDGKQYLVEVEVLEEDEGPKFPAYVPPPTPSILHPVSMSNVPSGALGDQSGEPGVCRSPLAGLVTSVKVEPGQHVRAEEVMIIIEAMKMETNIVAAAPATVRAVKVANGDAVKLNQVLVEFD